VAYSLDLTSEFSPPPIFNKISTSCPKFRSTERFAATDTVPFYGNGEIKC